MRHLRHKLIVWYLRRCAGAFHAYPYGEQGRYVVLMTDAGFHAYREGEAEVARWEDKWLEMSRHAYDQEERAHHAEAEVVRLRGELQAVRDREARTGEAFAALEKMNQQEKADCLETAEYLDRRESERGR